MSIYKPTWLYVKKHKITGLKYFGKTISCDPHKYKGSGTRWIRHLNKHGYDHVETIWTQLFESKEELQEFATAFSEIFDIVNANDWANLCPETGIDGGYRQNNHLKEWNKRPKTETWTKIISTVQKGNQHHAKKIMIEGSEFPSMRAASKYFSVSEQTIYQWIKRGKAIKL